MWLQRPRCRWWRSRGRRVRGTARASARPPDRALRALHRMDCCRLQGAESVRRALLRLMALRRATSTRKTWSCGSSNALATIRRRRARGNVYTRASSSVLPRAAWARRVGSAAGAALSARPRPDRPLDRPERRVGGHRGAAAAEASTLPQLAALGELHVRAQAQRDHRGGAGAPGEACAWANSRGPRDSPEAAPIRHPGETHRLTVSPAVLYWILRSSTVQYCCTVHKTLWNGGI